ncbi:DUF485 domain-containing protein [Nocardioides sp.]|uniref:DUF485 domain-containing protein n=1 Tax=Nocardioides sp. TaxID=35761 RepID=UPI002D7EF4DD|nr:DUF485 domain-containing protein [Nocardioides sp.]HET8961965.1 DUF485 domain-containing protein [Nocardioides sp.]
MSQQSEGSGVHQTSAHPLYLELHETSDFAELRRKFRGFVIPATIAFMSWYLLFVVMSNWADDFMSTPVIGNINVGLVFGLLQFVSTFLIAWLYGRYMERNVDPLARKLEKRYVDEAAGHGGADR